MSERILYLTLRQREVARSRIEMKLFTNRQGSPKSWTRSRTRSTWFTLEVERRQPICMELNLIWQTSKRTWNQSASAVRKECRNYLNLQVHQEILEGCISQAQISINYRLLKSIQPPFRMNRSVKRIGGWSNLIGKRDSLTSCQEWQLIRVHTSSEMKRRSAQAMSTLTWLSKARLLSMLFQFIIRSQSLSTISSRFSQKGRMHPTLNTSQKAGTTSTTLTCPAPKRKSASSSQPEKKDKERAN